MIIRNNNKKQSKDNMSPTCTGHYVFGDMRTEQNNKFLNLERTDSGIRQPRPIPVSKKSTLD